MKKTIAIAFKMETQAFYFCTDAEPALRDRAATQDYWRRQGVWVTFNEVEIPDDEIADYMANK